mgnify:CR=1 FL=1
MFNVYTVNATTSCTGSQLSMREQALGMDRHDLRTDGKLVTAATIPTVEVFKSTTLGNILSSDKFISFDLLARNVIEEGYDHKTKVQVGRAGKVQEIRVDEKQFRQVGNVYYGDIT